MNIIPKPLKVLPAQGKLDLSNVSKVNIDERLNECQTLISEVFKTRAADGVTIDIKYDSSLKEEGYRLKIATDGIEISASTARGAIWAIQSLRVAGKLDVSGADHKVKCCVIEDEPNYGWRGVLIDEARHFYGIDFIKKIIDLMGMHKLNVLHWHLTDDQGWRIEIKKYPLLTEIGSKRSQSNINGWRGIDGDGIPHSGYYTQEQIKEVVAYALERGISILPEIDMPAHFAAAFAAYPWLACRDIKCEVPWYFGGKVPLSQGIKDWNRTACIGNPETMQFVYDVIDEVCELFPYPFYHIGGDEVPTEEWKKCPKCNELMKREGLKGVNEMHAWFNNKIQSYLKGKGKRLIGWNEVLMGSNLDRTVIAQYWVPITDKNVVKHIKLGGDVIISKHRNFYFDFAYAVYPLRNTYEFTPYISGIKPKHREHVLGVEGAVWTEWIPDAYKLEFLLFPRMGALAEAGWSSGKKDYKEFVSRVRDFEPILDAFDVNYAEEEICIVKSGLMRKARIQKNFFYGDQDIELKENAAIKERKGKRRKDR
ncbi:MAG: beta-N-acetylhexosaminidase [Clostridia bacterium]|nr:beta-N-acetylhexosaminidase [Clostridia bacterium]